MDVFEFTDDDSDDDLEFLAGEEEEKGVRMEHDIGLTWGVHPTMDLSSDTGAIGRFHTHGDSAVMLDIKAYQALAIRLRCPGQPSG
ncbi:hypothetical protein ATCC90586_009014 [Pythium insidiosum]|nr:hypothetical protein ATCC90586_009014 [Pythium insidiosum]